MNESLPPADRPAPVPPSGPPRAEPVGGTAPDRSAMIERPRGLFGWLTRRVFGDIRVPAEAGERLRDLPLRGQPVFVMRTSSLLDYLYFNFLLLRERLPLVRFANGRNLTFFRGLRVWATDVWDRLRGRQAAEPDAATRLERTVRSGGVALLFMKRRGLTAERPLSPGFIERLIMVQRQLDRPLLLVPQVLAWPRKPPSRRRTWLDVAFGDLEAAGRLRKLVHFLLNRKRASVEIGEPIDLRRVLDEHPGWTDARIARKVRRVLFIHLGREAMAIRGPAVKPPALIRREIFERNGFQREIRDEAKRLGLPPEAALDEAQRCLKEIAATTSFETLVLFGKLLDPVFNRVFKGVEVDAAGMRRVKEAAKLSRSAPLVLVPSHKSHVDYLVISWVFMRNEFIPPHIAAGDNLNFFPLGWWLRRSGAFFLRRSFVGQSIYKLVFRRYLWKLVREGYPLEFFIEGGRSRTGKLLPPKLGMLSMLMEGARLGEFKDLQFVPVSLSYEQVVETASYRRELTGGSKRAEGVGSMVRAGKVLRSRYGRIYVSFEEPVRLSSWLDANGVGSLAGLSDEVARPLNMRLAYHLMRRIQEATVVSPTALVGAAMLSHSQRGTSGARLRELVGYLVNLLGRRGARLSRSLNHYLEQHRAYISESEQRSLIEGHRARGEAVRPLIDEALEQLRKLITHVDRGTEKLYTVPDRARIELDYYRNPILCILAPDLIMATAIRASELPLSKERLSRQVRRLSYWFRLEFIYQTDATYDENFETTLGQMVEEELVRIDEQDRVVAAAPLTLDFLRGALQHLVEGYWIAADALRGLAHAEMEQREWIEHAREHGEREFMEGDIQRPESASTAVLANALSLFEREGMVERIERGAGRRTTTAWRLAQGVSLEKVAYRRDDLGEFLLRRPRQLPKPVGAPRHPVGETITVEEPAAVIDAPTPSPVRVSLDAATESADEGGSPETGPSPTARE